MKDELVVEAIKATPATAVSGLVILGVPLSDWVLFGSAVLIALQVFFLLRDKWWRERASKD